MPKFPAVAVFAAVLALPMLSPGFATPAQQPQAPSDAELQTRADKLIANQHRNEQFLDEYERLERQVDQTAGMTPKVLEDRTYRIVPTGTGTMKILVSDRGKATDPAEYRKELQLWEQTLELMLKPNDSRTKTAYAKFEKKKKDRAELINSMREGLLRKWTGQEAINGHLCDVIQLDPNPEFHPRSTLQEAITRVTAKIWVDHSLNQLVRAEAHVVRDISFGGGILGKLYRGGVFAFDQSEVAPGVWLPARYQYDYTARKFLFTFEQHQWIEVSHYRRVGSPKEALALVQSELASGKSLTADP
jgi:hypothetical protein